MSEPLFYEDTTLWTDNLVNAVRSLDSRARACRDIVGARSAPYGDPARLAAPAETLPTPVVAWDVLNDKLDNVHARLMEIQGGVERQLQDDLPFVMCACLLTMNVFRTARVFVMIDPQLGETELVLAPTAESGTYAMTCKTTHAPEVWSGIDSFCVSCPVRIALAADPTCDVGGVPRSRTLADGRVVYTYSVTLQSHQLSTAFQRLAARWPCTIHMCGPSGAARLSFRGTGDGTLRAYNARVGSVGAPHVASA